MRRAILLLAMMTATLVLGSGVALTVTRIARQLFVSPKTVRNHISHIFTKLQIADRTQAILRAREAGLGGDAAS